MGLERDGDASGVVLGDHEGNAHQVLAMIRRLGMFEFEIGDRVRLTARALRLECFADGVRRYGTVLDVRPKTARHREPWVVHTVEWERCFRWDGQPDRSGVAAEFLELAAEPHLEPDAWMVELAAVWRALPVIAPTANDPRSRRMRMSPERRREIARMGARARWARRDAGSSASVSH